MDETLLRGELGWNIYALNQDFILTPEIEASYLYVTQDGYREFGSPMSLNVASNNNSSLVLGAYFNGAYHLASMNQAVDYLKTYYQVKQIRMIGYSGGGTIAALLLHVSGS